MKILKVKKMNRLKAPLNPFWTKVRNVSAVVAGVCGIVLVAPVALPAGAIVVLTNLAVIAGTISGTAQFTKK